MKKRPLYYVLSTHWDREWYQTFQNYRYRLVDLMDDVLDGISTGELKGPFYNDGQVCLIEDYLEVNPHRRDEVSACINNRQIAAGPWYVLPDEFLVSGEAMIRNLRMGFDTVRELGGEPSRTGFLCDMFGHISQMPQILKGFGINNAFIWRGLNFKNRNIIWEGADGSRVYSHVFGNDGYGDFAIITRKAAQDQYLDFSPKDFAKLLEEYLQLESERNAILPILLFDGLDHQCWDRRAYQELFKLLEKDERFELRHTSLDEYANTMLTEFSAVKNVVKGQLRKVAEDYTTNEWLITGVASSRVDLKQDNTVCQNSLCHWAEPFSLLANLLTDKRYPTGFLNVAWKWLIKNHPHDSICGCSIDQVHKDMEFRFSQTSQIANRLTTEALKSIALETETKIDDHKLKVVVFNPLPQGMDEVVELDLQIPVDWPCFHEFFGFESKPTFLIKDHKGNIIEYQRIAQQLNHKNLVTFRTKTPDLYDTTEVKIALELTIPALGYTTLIIEKAQPKQPVRHSNCSQIAHSGNCLENEYLKITVGASGTVKLLDKRNGQIYEDLLIFEDNADIGDGWYYGIAVNDEIYNSYHSPCQIAVIANGPELGRLKIQSTLKLPGKFDFSVMRRSSKTVEFTINSYLTLRKGADKLEVETLVDNNVCDHRLRVSFPTAANTENYLADSLFDVIEQPVSLPPDNYKKKEIDTDAKPQYSWTAISDNKRGLAIVSTGQYESGVTDEPAKPIKLTLFRSTRRTVMTNGEPGGQLLKPLSFKYNIMPIEGKADRLKIYNEALKLATGIKSCQLRNQDITVAKPTGSLPPCQGIINLTGAVMSSFSMIGDKCELRCFNPSDEQSQVSIEFLEPKFVRRFQTAVKCDLDFKKELNLKITAGKLDTKAKPKEITTIVFGTN